MESSNCIYCKIIKGELPAYRVYENEHVLAFLDIRPMAPGHTVVIPKAHFATLVELPEEEVEPLFEAVQAVAKKVARALGSSNANIGINQGEVAGQVVPHLHVHIFPRFPNDGGGTVHSIVHNPPKITLQEMVDKINQF